MDQPDAKTPVWSLTPAQLARECRLIAEGNPPEAKSADAESGHAESADIGPEEADARVAEIDQSLRDEARRLYAVWQEALDQPGDSDSVRGHKAVLQAGLRKRTVEILIKIRGTS